METICVAGIEINVFHRGDDLPSIGVFLLHGRMSKKDHLNHLAFRIAESNTKLIVFAIDQRNHGSRTINKDKNLDWKSGNSTHHLDMWTMQIGTMMDCCLLMDLLPLFGYSNIREWGVCGVSMGGHVSLMLTGYDNRIKYCVSIIGCLDFMTLMNLRKPEEIRFKEEYLVSISKYNAFSNLQKTTAEVLMLNGSLDELVPPEVNQGISEITNIAYKEFQVAHVLDEEMISDTISYFKSK